MSKCGRHEYKHYISVADYYLLRSKLKTLMKLDSNAKSDSKYSIRSLYFDNDCDKVLLEKLDGIDNRNKYRIRTYNKDIKNIHFEKKSKRNGICFKESVAITKEECKKILSGDIEYLKDSNNNLLREFYMQISIYNMKPKTIVDYDREAKVSNIGMRKRAIQLLPSWLKMILLTDTVLK